MFWILTIVIDVICYLIYYTTVCRIYKQEECELGIDMSKKKYEGMRVLRPMFILLAIIPGVNIISATMFVIKYEDIYKWLQS